MLFCEVLLCEVLFCAVLSSALPKMSSALSVLLLVVDCADEAGDVSLLFEFVEHAANEHTNNAVIMIAVVLFNIVMTSLLSLPLAFGLRCVLFFVMSVL